MTTDSLITSAHDAGSIHGAGDKPGNADACLRAWTGRGGRVVTMAGVLGCWPVVRDAYLRGFRASANATPNY